MQVQLVDLVPIFPSNAVIPSRSCFKTSDQVQGQGVPLIERGAYTRVREHFNSRDKAAIGP
jgi:hypothetical protein